MKLHHGLFLAAAFLLPSCAGRADLPRPEAQAETRSAAPAGALDPLLGSWDGTGAMFGTEATFRMAWEPAPQGDLVFLSFRNRMQMPDGSERGIDARAVYRAEAPGRFRGVWFDTRGVRQPLEATLEPHTDGLTLTTLWGTSDTERGRTVYRASAGSVTVEDFVWKNETWSPFARAEYARTPGSDTPVPSWTPLPETIATGAELAVLNGPLDAERLPYVLQVRLAPGGSIVPHTHPDTRTVAVLSGVLHAGQERAGEMITTRHPAGSLFEVPAGVVHRAEAGPEGVVYREMGIGPTANEFPE